MDNEAMFDGKGGEGEGEGGEEAPELVPNKPSLTCNAKTKVPVTVLTGFLGAGKSTLLGRILSERHGMKIAVVMNELGPTCALDRAILWNKTGTAASEWLTVENGCLCCTAKNETFLALESLLLRRDDIEHVIVEASGAADPAALVSKLWIDEALESRVVLDAVIAVVDVSTAQRFLVSNSPQYSVEAARQVAIADLILLNKVDLAIGDEQIEQAEAVIHSINSVAQITKTHFSK